MQYCSHQYWMGSINLLSFIALSLLSINIKKRKNLSWKRRDSKPGHRGAKLERYRCAMATPLPLIYFYLMVTTAVVHFEASETDKRTMPRLPLIQFDELHFSSLTQFAFVAIGAHKSRGQFYSLSFKLYLSLGKSSVKTSKQFRRGF